MAEAIEHHEFDPLATGSKRRQFLSKFTVYFLLAVFGLYYLMPLLIIIVNSMRPLDEIVRGGFIALPKSLSLQYWAEAWGTFCIAGTCEGVSRFFFNSLMMTVPATIISTTLGLINGYILSKWRFRGSEFLFGLITLGVFLPAQMTLLPWAFVLGNTGFLTRLPAWFLFTLCRGSRSQRSFAATISSISLTI